MRQFTTKLKPCFSNVKNSGTRKSGKDAGTLEEKRNATQPSAFCIAAGVFIRLPLLSCAPSRTPIGF